MTLTHVETKHVKFFERCLALLPSEFCEFDSMHTSLVFFCVAGICVLDEAKRRSLRSSVKQWLAKLAVYNAGYRGSASHNLQCASAYDVPNLAATYFGLMLMAMVQIPLSETALDRTAIVRYLGQCQRVDGSFAPSFHSSTGPYGDNDLRYVYFACAILHVLDAVSNPVSGHGPSLDKLVEYIHNLRCYDGGLTTISGAESHAGLTFCGVSALHLIGRLDKAQWQSTVDYCVRRQNPQLIDGAVVWGFNGRVNKPLDTCYSFWAGATLCLLGHKHLINHLANEQFLLNHTHSPLLGGFCKNTIESRPDPLHSFLGLASMKLDNDVDPALAIPIDARTYLKHTLG